MLWKLLNVSSWCRSKGEKPLTFVWLCSVVFNVYNNPIRRETCKDSSRGFGSAYVLGREPVAFVINSVILMIFFLFFFFLLTFTNFLYFFFENGGQAGNFSELGDASRRVNKRTSTNFDSPSCHPILLHRLPNNTLENAHLVLSPHYLWLSFDFS